MPVDDPTRNADELPEETKKAIRFVNCIALALNPQERPFLNTDMKAALLSFMLEIRPAVLFEGGISQTGKIEEFFKENNIDCVIYRSPHGNSLIINRKNIRERIEREIKTDPQFAKDLQWKEGMDLEQWVTLADEQGNYQQRGIVGFLLGYPKSAIQAGIKGKIENRSHIDIEGPYGGRSLYFYTSAEKAEAKDVKDLIEKARERFRASGLDRFFQKTSQ